MSLGKAKHENHAGIARRRCVARMQGARKKRRGTNRTFKKQKAAVHGQTWSSAFRRRRKRRPWWGGTHTKRNRQPNKQAAFARVGSCSFAVVDVLSCFVFLLRVLPRNAHRRKRWRELRRRRRKRESKQEQRMTNTQRNESQLQVVFDKIKACSFCVASCFSHPACLGPLGIVETNLAPSQVWPENFGGRLGP